nr:hypothetical protein [Tanacetum cinerariifolium]
DLVETEIPKLPHTISSPTPLPDTSGARSTSSDSTTPLSPDRPLTHTTPFLVPSLCRTVRMAVRVSPAMSPGLSASIAEVATMFDYAFRKRFRSSYDSSPSSTILVQKRYRCRSELILDTDSKEDEVRDEDIDEDGGDESLDADDEGHGLDDEGHGLDGEGCSIDEEGHGVESDGLGLEEEDEEDVLEGQQQVGPVVEAAMSEPLGLGYETLRHLELAVKEGQVHSTFEVGQGSGSVPEPERPERVFTSGYPTSIILVDEDQFIEIGVQLELYKGILQDHTQHFDAMSPTLFIEIDRDVRELYTRLRIVKNEIFSQRYQLRSLEYEYARTAMTFRPLWRPVLALEAWAGNVDTRMERMSWASHESNSCHLNTTRHHPAATDPVLVEVDTADSIGHTVAEHSLAGCRLPTVEHYKP